MIKKLVKYGNSNALVLDKALLEILNITDTTKLKLSTDGKSLVVTPLMATEGSKQPISLAEGEAMWHLIPSKANEATKQFEKLTPEELANYQADLQTLMNEFNKKYNYQLKCIAMSNNADYKKEHEELAQRSVIQELPIEAYYKEGMALLQKYMPDVPHDEIQQKQKELALKYKK